MFVVLLRFAENKHLASEHMTGPSDPRRPWRARLAWYGRTLELRSLYSRSDHDISQDGGWRLRR